MHSAAAGGQVGGLAPRCFLAIACAAALVGGLAVADPAAAAEPARPTNLVLIMTDNQGAWTFGCYGNPDIRTPHVDRLAADGIRFDRAYSSNSVCSPTRATFLTGLIPSQHGVHSYLGQEKPSAQLGPAAYSTIAEFRSLPKILSGRGYQCGLSGKWHLGDSLRPQEGFTYWFTKTIGSTRTFYGEDAIWQGEVYKEPRYFTDVIVEHALDFLAHRDAGRPFFLFVSFNAPYGLGGTMREVHRNRHTDYYADRELPSFPRTEMHPWLYNNREFLNNPMSIRSYAAAVSGMDDGVGRVLAALDEAGLRDETLVVFTADQGLCGGQGGFWGMGDHSRPIHTREDSLRIPLLARHPPRIPAGSTSARLVSNYDLLPSVLEYLGLQAETPREPPLPGASFAPLLEGRPLDDGRDAVFFEYENTRMIRTDPWKLTRRHPAGPDELYAIDRDPGETRNLIDDPATAEVRAALAARLDAFFAKYADPQYDLWHGGRSKAGRLLKK